MNTAHTYPFQIHKEIVYSVRIWRRALTDSLRRVNSYHFSGCLLLELAGGGSPLSRHVVPDWNHFVVDKNIDTFSQGNHQNIVADVHHLPINNHTVSLIITISSLQYFDHETFFAECHRVLKKDGVVAVHENGALNPIILLVRLARKIFGLFNQNTRTYCATINKYYRPENVPEGFELIFQHADGFFLPILFILEKFRVPGTAHMLPVMQKLDDFLFLKLPALRRFAFFNVIHLRRA